MYNYDKFFKEHPLNIHDQPERHDKIASLCKEPVIDIGCGTGTLTEYYKGVYTGYDISEEAIKQARENRRKDAKFFAGDFLSFNGYDFTAYNTIVMSEFLEHINDDKVIFDSIKQTAKYDTRIIISVPNWNRIPTDEHIRIFTVADLKQKFKNYGNLKFYNWPGEVQRIIMTIDFKVPSRNILTLGIVAKDEAKGIERAILSALEATDNIVITVDDKTTDDTEQIAKRYTKNVFKYKWQDDFSGARNQLLEKVTTPWILFLDGHEFLERYSGLQDLGEVENDALMCELKLESNTIVRYPKLHRSNLRYKDKIHNNLVAKNVGNLNNILVTHDRVTGQDDKSTKAREKQKEEMINRIMGAAIKKNKKDTRAALHLGLHYNARNKLKKAAKYYKLYLRYSKHPGERWFVRFNLMLILIAQNKNVRAEYQTFLMEKESPGRWETEYMRGVTLMNQQKYEEALIILTESLGSRKQESAYKPMPKDYSLIWNNIGESYFKLGKFYEASEAFLKASKHANKGDFKGLLQRRGKLMQKMAENQRSIK